MPHWPTTLSISDDKELTDSATNTTTDALPPSSAESQIEGREKYYIVKHKLRIRCLPRQITPRGKWKIPDIPGPNLYSRPLGDRSVNQERNIGLRTLCLFLLLYTLAPVTTQTYRCDLQGSPDYFQARI